MLLKKFILLMSFILLSAATSAEMVEFHGKTWIYWDWIAYGDDFLISINGDEVKNTSNSFYNATELCCGTNYTIEVYVNSADIYFSDTSSTADCAEEDDKVIVVWVNLEKSEISWFQSIFNNLLMIFIN